MTFKVGDMAMVVKPTPCGCPVDLGRVFAVEQILGPLHAHYCCDMCGAISCYPNLIGIGDLTFGVASDRCVKLPDLGDETQDDTVKELEHV